MKKLSIAILALLTTATTASAQYYHSTVKRKSEDNSRALSDKFYARVAVGYAFQHAGAITDAFGEPYSGADNYDNNGNFTGYNYKKASLNTGLHGLLGVGYMFSKHVGVELAGDFGLAPKKYTYTIDGGELNTLPANTTITNHAQTPVYLMPSLVLQSGGKLNLYMRAGLALPLNSKYILHEEDYYPTGGPSVADMEIDDFGFTVKSSFSMGYTGAVGVSYELGDHIKVFAEADMLSLSVYAKSYSLTQYTINGQDVLPQVKAQGSATTTSFSLSGGANSTAITSQSIPYSSIGLMAGFSFGF